MSRVGPGEKGPDVVIAGAGPAGVATALSAIAADPSLAGRIVVYDRARFPRGKPCGGGLTGHIEEAMAALGLRLLVPSFASPSAVVKYGRWQRTVALGRPVRTVRREEFDASLVAQARERGVLICEGVAVRGFELGPGGVEVELSNRTTVRARVLVGADGVGSLVRKALASRRDASSRSSTVPGFAGPGAGGDDASDGSRGRGALRPIRLFRAELPDTSWRRAEMLYDFTPMLDGLRGYLWIFPVPGGLINVGVLHDPTVQRSGAELGALLVARLGEYGINLPPGSLRGWPAWGYRPAHPVAARHLLTVGDAAGIDALTGEGIAVALEQGAIAGASIAAALRTGDLRFRGYGRALSRATVGRELSLDRLLARMLYGGRDHRQWLSLVLHDERMLDLYAARVSGTMVLADRKRELAFALARHVWHGRARAKATLDAEAAIGT